MSETQTKNCQNCKQSFQIEPEDFAFYEKIKVPPPTRCPECRFFRRIIFRNDRNLYKRPDSRTGSSIFAMHSSDSPLQVWERNDWFADDWDAVEYGMNIDWNRPFLEQIKELMHKVPWMSRAVSFDVNSDYCINANHIKDCYLVFGTAHAENCFYTDQSSNVSNSYDSAYQNECDVTYEGFFNSKCFKMFFSSFCEGSHNLWFCRDCIGCNDCFGSVGLRNKSYYFFNQSLSKEEYEKKIQSLNLSSFLSLEAIKKEVLEFWRKFPTKFIQGRHNLDVTGEYISYSKNVKNSYHVQLGENLKFCQAIYVSKSRDSYDHFRWGQNSELIYESSICGVNISNLLFCLDCWPDCQRLQYCMSCHNNVRDCFGCVGLRNKQYCILNKQYSKEEYETLLPKIVEHMNAMPYVGQQGRIYKYGEFFPPEFSPFAYNETVAQEHFPLTREEASDKGFRWHKPDSKNYSISLNDKDLQDGIKGVNGSILQEVIGCTHRGTCGENCSTAFKIIPQELEFYRTMGLPLPRLCPNCRFGQRLKQKNPNKLYERGCNCGGETSANSIYANIQAHFHNQDKCPNTFQTSYAPDRPEIVYCEQCYQAEVV